MLFIASVQGYTAGVDGTLDASSTLNIAAGDVLVLITNPDIGGNTIDWMGEDDESSNGLTILGSTGGTFEMTTGYLLAASANAAATMRVVVSGDTNTAGWEFTCLQFRPEAGETVGFGSGPASNNGSYGTNPISGQLSTAFTDSLFVGGAFNDRAALSNHALGGSAPDAVITGTADFDVGYTIFSSAQTNITYGASSGAGVWAAQLLVLDIASTPGGGVIQKVLNDTGINQIIMGGRIIHAMLIVQSIMANLALAYMFWQLQRKKQELLMYRKPTQRLLDKMQSVIELDKYLEGDG